MRPTHEWEQNLFSVAGRSAVAGVGPSPRLSMEMGHSSGFTLGATGAEKPSSTFPCWLGTVPGAPR